MVANLVITDHNELDNVGTFTHSQIDAQLSASFLLVSSSVQQPAGSRVLVAGPGITILDTGTQLIVSATAASAQVSFSWNEVPIGAVDGLNRVFVFSQSPNPMNAMMLFLNGVKQREGSASDFTLSGSTVTFDISNIPRSGSNIDATYQY